MRTRFAARAVVALFATTLSLASLGRYQLAWAGSVTCCCGEHSAEDDCGCPSCPAAHQGQDQQGDDDQLTAKVQRCGGSSTMISPRAVHLAGLAARAPLVFPRPVRRPAAPHTEHPPAAPVFRPAAPDS